MDEKTAEEAVAEILPTAVAGQDPAPAPFLKAIPPTVVLPSQQRLPPPVHVQYVYTRLQLAEGLVPPSEFGRMLAHSYADHGNWYVMMVLDSYQMAGTGQFAGTVNHFSPWSYDRQGATGFYGTPFVPGEYHERVAL